MTGGIAIVCVVVMGNAGSIRAEFWSASTREDRIAHEIALGAGSIDAVAACETARRSQP
jgi:hypothetical protein